MMLFLVTWAIEFRRKKIAVYPLTCRIKIRVGTLYLLKTGKNDIMQLNSSQILEYDRHRGLKHKRKLNKVFLNIIFAGLTYFKS